jgi:probable rRNA maturation factor
VQHVERTERADTSDDGDTINADLLRETAVATLEHQNQAAPLSLTVVVTGDSVVRRLNRTYRGVDATTDVLAFGNQGEDTFTQLPDYLGDVIISFPKAQSQAGQAGHPVEAELQLLVVHGVLHLLGHDHEISEEKAAMWAAQAEILRGLDAAVADMTPERNE